MKKIMYSIILLLLIIWEINAHSLEERQNDCDCQVIVNLTNSNFYSIGVNFITSPCVTELILRDNKIKSIDFGAFNGLPKLKVLDLSNNNLSAKQTLISFGPTNVESLILDNNFNISDRHTYQFNISSIQPNLKYLSLKNTKISGFYAKLNVSLYLPKIESLDISNNHLYHSLLLPLIPNTVSHLNLDNTGMADSDANHTFWMKNVKSLSLSGNKEIKYIWSPTNKFCQNEEGLCLHMTSLENLTLTHCNIWQISYDAFKFTNNLLSLNLSHNNIKHFPFELLGRVPNLRELDLSDNPFKDVPPFNFVENLKVLKMNNMYDTSIITNILKQYWNLTKLEILSFSGGKIYNLPIEMLSNLPALRELDLSINFIKTIGFNIGKLNYLEKLYLRDNLITEIDHLSINGSKSLQILDIRENLIANFKASTFKYLPNNLTILYKNNF